MSVEKLLVEFLDKHPEFTVYKSSSAEDIDNLLAQRDLLLLLEKAYELGFEEGEGCGANSIQVWE